MWENILLLSKFLNTDEDPEVNKIVDILTRGKVKPDIIEKTIAVYKDNTNAKHA